MCYVCVTLIHWLMFVGMGISDTAGNYGLTTVEMDDLKEDTATKKDNEKEDEEKQNRKKKVQLKD